MGDFVSPRVMGIINCTPDSFYSESRHIGPAEVWDTVCRMIEDGVDILDIGGESTRPGSTGVDPEEQIARVIPAIRVIRDHSAIPISVDTCSRKVAEEALDAGADIVNDVSALTGDSSMGSLVAERGVPIILMHMRGRPATMQNDPSYDDVAMEVRRELKEAVRRGEEAGILAKNIILDPGIGFGKRQEDNEALLAQPDRWRLPGFPILIGLSRKSFLGRIFNAKNAREADSVRGKAADSPEDRLIATVAAHAWCLGQGVDILRVHDVKETRQLIAVWRRLAWAS